jgi:MFS family permease
MLIGALLFGRLGRRWTHAGKLVRISLLLAGATCAVVLAGAGVWHALLLVPLWLLGGICNGGINVFTNVVMADRVPAAARGRAFAAMGAAIQGAGMVGYIVGGPLIDNFAPRPLVAAAGLAGLVAVGFCLPVVRRAGREIGPLPRAGTRSARPAGDSVGV